MASRATIPNASVSPNRCSSETPSAGDPPLSAVLIASRAGLKGKTAEITLTTSYRETATAPLGTSARKASGSDSKSASSDAALTSRATDPIATPNPPQASAPASTATSHSAKRLQSRPTNSPMPINMTSDTQNEQPPA